MFSNFDKFFWDCLSNKNNFLTKFTKEGWLSSYKKSKLEMFYEFAIKIFKNY